MSRELPGELGQGRGGETWSQLLFAVVSLIATEFAINDERADDDAVCRGESLLSI